MKRATFTRAAVYHVRADCKTPLRTGGAEHSGESVLRSWDGSALIPGTSLAGAFREWMENSTIGASSAQILFGDRSCEGHLVVSDAIFEEEAKQVMRPRLRICGETGTADDGGKFDVAHIETGSCFDFTLTWFGDSSDIQELDWIEQILAALHEGDILLGAQKSNGFGQVELTVRKRVYNMEDRSDRTAWLEEKDDAEPFQLLAMARRRQVVFRVTGRMDQVLVKAGAQEQRSGGGVTVNITERGQAVIPGSSVKGAIRARVKAILPTLGLDAEETERLFGRGAEGGDNGVVGSVRCSDVLLEEKKQEVRRIRINRFTGGVMRGGLFGEEPHTGGIELRLTVPEDGVSCLVVLLALRDLGLGLYNLGSNGAIGRGYLRKAKITAEHPDGRVLHLNFDEKYVGKLDDPSDLYGEWSGELKGVRS